MIRVRFPEFGGVFHTHKVNFTLKADSEVDSVQSYARCSCFLLICLI